LEILIALVERAGELVSKGELMARVWPNTVVEESNLKTHVANLRRILGDGQPGRRYLANVPGRGYCFVAPVEFSELGKPTARPSAAVERAHNLPALQTRTVGRGNTIRVLLEQLPQQRLVTIVGAGGIGKTTVALAVSETLIAVYEHGVRFVDLAPLRDPHLVVGALASALGLAIHADNAVASLIGHLEGKRMLLVLDSCEHFIEAAAALSEQILERASGIHILATSREPMRAKGERVYRLLPLEFPPSSSGLVASEALEFPSVQLFVERAAANVEGFDLNDADAPVVAAICRKLEGVPLAIELAATRVDAFGIRQLSMLLDDRFRLLRYGRRTVLPRHQTLAAALDWSYEFLPEYERVVLRRLSVFSSFFTLESARAVAGGANLDVVDGLASLVAKSLVSADVSATEVRYRLLDITRAYAMQKLTDSGELEQSVRRHAEHHLDLFKRAETELKTRSTAEWLQDYGPRINDVRSALTWAFSSFGDTCTGVALTIASGPLWMHLSLVDESRECIERALASHSEHADRNERDEMKLLAALAAALPNAGGPLPKTDAVWMKAIALAEKLGESEYRLHAMWSLFIYRMYVGDFRGALAVAETCCGSEHTGSDAAAQLIGDRLKGIALHYLGDHASARHHLKNVLSECGATVHRSHIFGFLVEHRVTARAMLSRVLWMQGFPDQAVGNARDAVDEAKESDQALSVCTALAHAACPIALYVGDLAEAERLISTLTEYSAKHPLSLWDPLGRCLKGALLLARGEVAGLALLRFALDWLRRAGFGYYDATFLGTLAQGMAVAGQLPSARVAIDEALDQCERSAGRWCLPELLRIKGELLRSGGPGSSVKAAETCFRQAIDCARRQGALSWEMRAVTSLAEVWHADGKTAEAKQLLSSAYNRFSEGFETRDLRTARARLDELGRL
jgi:predicted ATPase/DNA-binding winged helix-turn-helix (wHTH) protein